MTSPVIAAASTASRCDRHGPTPGMIGNSAPARRRCRGDRADQDAAAHLALLPESADHAADDRSRRFRCRISKRRSSRRTPGLQAVDALTGPARPRYPSGSVCHHHGDLPERTGDEERPRRDHQFARDDPNGASGLDLDFVPRGSRNSSNGRMQRALRSRASTLRASPRRSARTEPECDGPTNIRTASPTTAKPAAMPQALAKVDDQHRSAALFGRAHSPRTATGRAVSAPVVPIPSTSARRTGPVCWARSCQQRPERPDPARMIISIATRLQRSTQIPIGIENSTSGTAAPSPWIMPSALSLRRIRPWRFPARPERSGAW